MGKIAFIFPGQGAQYVGMGKDFYENNSNSKEIFDKANNILDFNVKGICFEPNDRLHVTEYTQASMLTACVAILKAIEEKGIRPDVTAGLSLGEYCALVANGALSFEDAVTVVRKRGIFMQEDVPSGIGTMSAILGLDANTVECVCSQIEGIVMPANYNCPGQIIISGEKTAVDKANEKLKEAGAKRILPLNVSGPFHSTMLTGAGNKLHEVLSHITFNDYNIPYIPNVTAEIMTDKSQIKDLLTKQVSSSVKWQQSVEYMIADGVDTFIEIGPGKTLTGFLKKIDKTKTAINIDKLEDLEKLNILLRE